VRRGVDVKGRKFFWFVWGFDALIAAIVLFFWGVVDGTVSSFNMGLWMVMLLALAGIIGGSFRLQSKDRTRPAMGLLLLLAIPGALGVLFFLAVLILQPRWN
jgi:hypothetical protein